MTDPLKPVPSQIDSVIDIDRMDEKDRHKLDPRIKLRLLCEEAKSKFGQDPRIGHRFVFVGRPRAILQLMIDMLRTPILTNEIKLERPIILGMMGADIVGYWESIPLVVRSNVVNDDIWCVKVDHLPESSQVDRQRAGELRIRGHAGTLDELRGD